MDEDGISGQPASWCDRCGGGLADGDHAACAAARALEPPRFCPHCRRRMKVQVLPAGWASSCVQHGLLGPAQPAAPRQPRSESGR